MALVFARQPILDRNNRIYGYELLYRDGMGQSYQSKDGDAATSQVMAASFLSMGFEEISGTKKAFINFTDRMLQNRIATLFPKKKLVVEILENVEPTAEIIEACRKLKARGYMLALDDFIFRPGYEALIELADIIKVDFQSTPLPAMRLEIIRKFGNGRIHFLAEKVETHEDHQMAMRMGYSLFQGYYYCKPVLVHSQGVPPSKMNHLQLIKLLKQEDPGFDELVDLIEKDVAFSLEILKIANSVYYYRGNSVTSVRRAALTMGLKELKKWAFITALRKIGDSNHDAVIKTSVERAKFLELLCDKSGRILYKTELFTLGLLSMIDALTGCEMSELLPELPLSEEAKQILRSAYDDSVMSIFFRLMLAFEQGDWEKQKSLSRLCGIAPEQVAEAYTGAVIWANRCDLV